MKLKLFSVICILLLFSAASIFSAITGKVTGVITDADNQQPLVGVSVAIQGTSLGAITDVDGRYNILNVPVGTFTLKISTVGYQVVEVLQVNVHADLATYQNQGLSSKVTDIGQTISVTAEAPMVIKDKTTTINIVKSEEIQALPTRGFEEVVGIQNSVVRMNINADNAQRGGAARKANGPSVNIRGGRPSEVAYYVDGFSQQDPLTGLSTSNISNNAIQEVSIITGAFPAEYGHVASGIVNVITKSGSDEYHGTIEGVTDNFASGSKKIYDHNFYTADFSGPLPGLEKGYFYVSGERRYLQDRTPSPVTEELFGEYGVPTDNGNVLPNNHLSGWSYQGKFDYSFSPNFKLVLNGNGSVDSWQDYNHAYNNLDQLGEIEHTARYEDKNYGINAKITHTLNADNFYNLSLSFFSTERFRGDGILWDDYAAYDRGYDIDGNKIPNPRQDVHNLMKEGDSIYVTVIDSITDPLNHDTSEVFSEFREAYFDDYLKRKSQYIGVKGDYTSQLNQFHTLKVGFDFQQHTLRYYRDLSPTEGYDPANINRYGYDSLGNESDSEGFKNDTKKPINIGIYIQDRLDWRGLIVNAGLRFDYFDYKALRITNLERPFDPDNIDESDLVIDETDLADSEKFSRLSPRLGISFPISDVTQMHINYGKFFQRPDLANLYIGYDFMEARIGAGSFYAFSSPNLEPEKITQYEIGFTRQLGEYTAVNFTTYYKDVQDLSQITTQAPAHPYQYDFYGNIDFGTIKGVDISFDMRRNNNISLNLKYSLSYANGTGSFSGTNFNIAWKNSEGGPKSTNPLDFDQRHTLIGGFDFMTVEGEGPAIGGYKVFENMNINLLANVGSGTPYTPTLVYDALSYASVKQAPTGAVNSANLPWHYTVDMKIQKVFKVNDYSIVPYFWVKNLFDTKNAIAVYEGTGEAYQTGYLEAPEGIKKSENPNNGEQYADRYNFLERNPKNYGAPRMIFAGLRIKF